MTTDQDFAGLGAAIVAIGHYFDIERFGLASPPDQLLDDAVTLCALVSAALGAPNGGRITLSAGLTDSLTNWPDDLAHYRTVIEGARNAASGHQPASRTNDAADTFQTLTGPKRTPKQAPRPFRPR